jgi:hypothetical protein
VPLVPAYLAIQHRRWAIEPRRDCGRITTMANEQDGGICVPSRIALGCPSSVVTDGVRWNHLRATFTTDFA